MHVCREMADGESLVFFLYIDDVIRLFSAYMYEKEGDTF